MEKNPNAKQKETDALKGNNKAPIAKKMIALAAVMMLLSGTAAMANEAKMEAKTDYYFSKMDTNNDGMISKEEHDKFASDMFSKADKNNDGSISKDELKAAKESEMKDMKAEMKGTTTKTHKSSSNTITNPSSTSTSSTEESSTDKSM